MKFMLMMHAPRGNGDYQTSAWKPEEFRAHRQGVDRARPGWEAARH